jgi:hypothetical protein
MHALIVRRKRAGQRLASGLPQGELLCWSTSNEMWPTIPLFSPKTSNSNSAGSPSRALPAGYVFRARLILMLAEGGCTASLSEP